MHHLPRLLFSALVLAAMAVSASAASTIRVPADHPTISAAIADAQDGDVILVSPGVYPEQIDFSGKNIVIRSITGPETTILDGQGLHTVVLFVGGEGPSARLDGFTVRNGRGVEVEYAGGIWCRNSSPTIANCIITGNYGWTAMTGGPGGAGGIGSERGSITVEGCVIESNFAGDGIDGAGGIAFERAGYYLYGPGVVIRDCVIRFNHGGDITTVGSAGAGGIYCGYAAAVIADCTIAENHGGNLPVDGIGGSIGIGGIDCQSSEVQVLRCRILSNQGGSDLNGDGSQDGGEGGILFKNSPSFHPHGFSGLTNSVIAWNQGGRGDHDGGTGGVLIHRQQIHVSNCAIVGNTGGPGGAVGGLETTSLTGHYAMTTLTNTLFWHNEGLARPNNFANANGTGPIMSNLLMGTDPGLVDPANGDFHLTCNSPAIDAGTDTAPGLPQRDIDREPRLIGAQVDIGPDEFLAPAAAYCQANPNSTGAAAHICGQGSRSIAENDFTVNVDGLPNTPGMLMYGPAQVQLSFGDGFRCVGGAVRRLAPMSATASSISIDINLANLPLMAGVQANFQYWYRDPMAGGSGFNLSDGLSVDFLQ